MKGMEQSNFKPKPSLPEVMPIKPAGRKGVPSLNDAEFERLGALVDRFPTLSPDSPEYAEWEALQRKADKDTVDK